MYVAICAEIASRTKVMPVASVFQHLPVSFYDCWREGIAGGARLIKGCHFGRFQWRGIFSTKCSRSVGGFEPLVVA